MAKHVLSIEIGQQITKVVEIDYRKKNPHVYRAVSFATPADVIDDGFIRDRDALAVAFREQLSQAGMREKSVVFSIASSKIATREITLPDVKENKVGALVMATAQDYFPVDLSNYSVAYSIIDSVKDENGKSLKVLLLAAPDSLVDNYYNFADTMGFNIESLDYFGNGSMQVLKNEIVGSYSACIQISGNSSTVSVMNEGQQLMQRSVNYGVFSIGDAIAQSPDNSINTLDAACDALTRETMLCRTLDYEGLEASATGSDFANALELQAARRVATDACGDLIMSIVRVLDFFRSQNPGTQLTGLYITGMGVNVKGIDDLFASEISVPIHKMEQLVSVTFPKKFTDSLYNPTEYIAVIGAAIAPVGFKSSSKGGEKVSTINMTPFYAVLGVAVVAGIALSAISIIRYSNENKRNEELKTTKESLSYV
ncbi:MAG: pilus assembly protein PilM, partial [Lachnospiraceae bacterium]|nr:pilus assembly protein PilM [Lachnospiraceae bacterium]